jgi:hypothetical protein
MPIKIFYYIHNDPNEFEIPFKNQYSQCGVFVREQGSKDFVRFIERDFQKLSNGETSLLEYASVHENRWETGRIINSVVYDSKKPVFLEHPSDSFEASEPSEETQIWKSYCDNRNLDKTYGDIIKAIESTGKNIIKRDLSFSEQLEGIENDYENEVILTSRGVGHFPLVSDLRDRGIEPKIVFPKVPYMLPPQFRLRSRHMKGMEVDRTEVLRLLPFLPLVNYFDSLGLTGHDAQCKASEVVSALSEEQIRESMKFATGKTLDFNEASFYLVMYLERKGLMNSGSST